MKIFKTLSVVLVAAALSFAALDAVFGQDQATYEEYIAANQPVCIGEVFYTKNTPKSGYQAYYKHMGFDGDNIVVKYELYYHYDELEERETYSLVTNAAKQALLCTRPFTGEDPAKVTKLLIKVEDSFGRLKVEKYKGQ